MADPLSALGALAAASQLVEQCLKITLFVSELRSKFRSIRGFIDTSAQQVDQLIGISRQIISNPYLQTETIANALEACLNDAQSLYTFLQNISFSARDSRVKRFRKTLTALRMRREIEAQSESLERWKGLLTLGISEANCAHLHTISRGVHISVEQTTSLADRAGSNGTTLADVLPSIFTQLSAIDSELRNLTTRTEATSKEAESSARITRNLEFILQRLAANQINSIQYSHFGSNVLTHYLVPIPRNKTFAGFDDTINKLQERYSTGSRSAERVLTLTGVACGGKTRAAIEFCHRAQSSQQFGAILWIKASSRNAIEKSFRAIANKLNVAETEPMEVKINTIMSILKSWPCPWLMILDNYNGSDPSRELDSYMPDSEQGSYLITRKLDDLTQSEKSSAIYLPELQLQEAVELLLNRSCVEKNDENFSQGLRLVQALGKMPRLIMQVGSCIKKRKVSLAEYHRMLQQSDKRSVAALFKEWKLTEEQRKLVRIGLEDYASDSNKSA